MKRQMRRRVRARGVGARVRRPPASATAAVRAEAKARSEGGGILIGGARDPVERAADRMATQALAGEPVALTPVAAPAVHRECDECATEDRARRRVGPGPTVAPGASSASAAPGAAAAVHALGSGRPLCRADRAMFEPRFGRDLSDVRVHDGAAADRAARAIAARAFTHGRDIAFASGARERGGAPLLAHELAHVVQEDGAVRRHVRRASGVAAEDVRQYKKVPKNQRKEARAAHDPVGRAVDSNKCKDGSGEPCTGGAAAPVKKPIDVDP